MRLAIPFALIAAPALAISAIASEPESGPTETTESEEASKAIEAEDAPQESKVTKTVEEERICRRIRVDMSSRRKEKVCMTAEEWRAFNQRR